MESISFKRNLIVQTSCLLQRQDSSTRVSLKLNTHRFSLFSFNFKPLRTIHFTQLKIFGASSKVFVHSLEWKSIVSAITRLCERERVSISGLTWKLELLLRGLKKCWKKGKRRSWPNYHVEVSPIDGRNPGKYRRSNPWTGRRGYNTTKQW